MIKNTTQHWGIVSKLLHWGIGILIIGMLAVGLWMMELAPSDQKWTIYGLHKSIGLLLLGLVIVRLIWRLANKVPAYPDDMPWHLKVASSATILCLYLLMLAMPLTGVVMSVFGGFSVPFFDWFALPALTEGRTPLSMFSRQLHTIFGWSFIALISLHTLGAFYHHVIRKDTIFKRMWFSK